MVAMSCPLRSDHELAHRGRRASGVGRGRGDPARDARFIAVTLAHIFSSVSS
jgi:hypothetical protein